MKNIHRLCAIGCLTDTQRLTAYKFWRSPNDFNLAPTLFRAMREIIIDEVPLGELEERRGWPARSAKMLVSVLLHAMEETEGMFWRLPDEAEVTSVEEAREMLDYLQGGDECEIADLQDRFGMTRMQATFLWRLLIDFDRTVCHDALASAVWGHNDWPDCYMSTLKVVVCKIRKIIQPHGLRITTLKGTGYRVHYVGDAAVRSQIRDAWRHKLGTGKGIDTVAQQMGRPPSAVLAQVTAESERREKSA